MPKRTNDFQKLVYLVRVNLAEVAKVTESKMLTDRVTKRLREVDVCIEGRVGGQRVTVCIECRDHQRIADVTWVDMMKAKHERLPTNVLILASRSGFTPEARDVATGFGIETFSLTDVDEVDFPALLDSASSLWTKSITIAVAHVLVRVRPSPSLAGETVRVSPTNLVYSSEGAEICPISALVEMLLKSPRAQQYLSDGTEEHIRFELTWAPPSDNLGNPFFMKKVEPEMFREIESIEIAGPCKFEIAKFGVRRGKMFDVHVAWGKTKIHGREAMVVATRTAGGEEKLSIQLAGSPE